MAKKKNQVGCLLEEFALSEAFRLIFVFDVLFLVQKNFSTDIYRQFC